MKRSKFAISRSGNAVRFWALGLAAIILLSHSTTTHGGFGRGTIGGIVGGGLEGGRDLGEQLAETTEETYDDVREAVTPTVEGAGQAIGDASKELWEYQRDLFVKQHWDILQKTREQWTNMNTMQQAAASDLASALRKRDEKAALKAFATLAINSAGMRTLVEEAKKDNFGSVVVMANAGGAAIVGGSGTVGIAVSVNEMIDFFRVGYFDADGDVIASIFVGAAGTIGASKGGSIAVSLGFAVDQPDEISGPGVDATLEGAYYIGMAATISFDPTKVFQVAGFDVGVTSGAEIDASVGGSFTHVIGEIKGEFDPFNKRPNSPSEATSTNGSANTTFGTFRLVVGTTGKHLHADDGGDKMISTRWQPADAFTSFVIERESDGYYRLKVQATGSYLHANDSESGDRQISTRWEPNDDYTRFALEPQANGIYRIRVKATGRYLTMVNGMLMTRQSNSQSVAEFWLIPANG